MDASTFSSLVRERLAKSGSASVGYVLGACMTPGLPHGVRLQLAALEADEPIPGRVYAYLYRERTFVHRCVRREGGVAIFAPDANLDAIGDRVEDLGHVIGRVEGYSVLGVRLTIDRRPARLVGRLLRAVDAGTRRLPEWLRRPLVGRAGAWLRRRP